MDDVSWEPFDGQREKRTIASWAKDLRYLDVVQVRDENGTLEYAILTPGATRIIAADTDEAALSAVDPDDIEGLEDVFWQESFEGEGEMRTLESWANDYGFVDIVQVRRFVDGDYDAGISYSVWTQDDWPEIPARTDEEARSHLSGWLMDDMRPSE